MATIRIVVRRARRRPGSPAASARSIAVASASRTSTFFCLRRIRRIGRRDVGRAQGGRGHLVEQGLEEVVVRAVDDGDAHGRALQGAAPRSSPPKPAPRITTWGRCSISVARQTARNVAAPGSAGWPSSWPVRWRRGARARGRPSPASVWPTAAAICSAVWGVGESAARTFAWSSSTAAAAFLPASTPGW